MTLREVTIFLDQVQKALNIKILVNQTSLQVKVSANQKSPLKKKRKTKKYKKCLQYTFLTVEIYPN